jgi:hypothetical protein
LAGTSTCSASTKPIISKHEKVNSTQQVAAMMLSPGALPHPAPQNRKAARIVGQGDDFPASLEIRWQIGFIEG